MGSNAVLLQYQSRLVDLHAAASQLRLGQMIALTIVLVAVAAILILAFLSTVKNSVALPNALIPLAIAMYAGRLFKIRHAAVLKTLRLQTFYQQGIARLTGMWAGSGISGDTFAPDNHAYAKDLHLFGEASLFELLCTCRTEVGQSHLADYLLQPSSLQETLQRQEAVRELKDNISLQEKVSLLGKYSFQQASWRTMSAWLESPSLPVHPIFQIACFLASFAVAILALLCWNNTLSWSPIVPWLGAALLGSGLLGCQYRSRILASAQVIRAVGLEVGIIHQGLSLLQAQNFRSPLLAGLVDTSRKADPPTRLRQLSRMINAFVERDKEWFYLGSRVLLVGTQLFFAIEKWRQIHADDMRHWLSTWGEFEALLALASYADEHPQNIFPDLSEAGPILEADAIAHPLLPEDSCVRNHVGLNEATSFYLITGSNMAGKSTLLRAIGLNVVLAYAGAPVCAERLHLSRLQLCVSMQVQDSLMDGKSKFLAEIERLKDALTTPAELGPVLFLVDELLSGTNSKDRRVASEVILRELIKRRGIGAITTHDLALTEIAEFEEMHGVNMHMAAVDDTDPMNFDYILKPGINRQSSALAIARLAGVPV